MTSDIKDLAGKEFASKIDESTEELADEQSHFHDTRDNDEKRSNKNKNHNKESGKKEKPNTKRVIPISKYSFNGKGDLHEAVLVSGKPYFIKYTNGKIELVEQIEENTRILRPPEKEEYPYKPYEFESMEELKQFISKALNISKDELYTNSKSIFTKYVDQDEYVINLLTMDSIWTYFQDLFPATHYVECIGTR